MEEAIRSGIPELGSFVVEIERDYDAVHAALRLPWREARHRGQSQQAKNTQTRYVWSCGLCSPATTARTRRLTVEELLDWSRRGEGFPSASPKTKMSQEYICVNTCERPEQFPFGLFRWIDA